MILWSECSDFNFIMKTNQIVWYNISFRDLIVFKKYVVNYVSQTLMPFGVFWKNGHAHPRITG